MAEESQTLVVPQARRVLERMGGASKTARIIREAGFTCDTATCYRWTYPRERGGTGGYIPGRRIEQLLRAARLAGIALTRDDFGAGGR